MAITRRDFLKYSAATGAGALLGVFDLKAIAAEPTKGIAENVILVIIDGLRNDEAFDDPTHQYIPHIWNDLRPQGVINTSFWNTGITLTTAAHATIFTGVRQPFANQGIASADQRAKYPNIFEYYRKQKNVPQEKVWFISGKGIITAGAHHSLHPDYANLGASIDKYWDTEEDTKPDDYIWPTVQQTMDQYHPSLLMINLRDVDHYGHQGVYTGYTDKIIVADQIVYDLWQKIQNDPYYKDKTDLIVTTDHGRNSEGYWTSFKDHGHHCHGNRHIMFLGIGPDFKQNEVVNIRRDHIDIAPTIGAILGVLTPYADGEVMTELFNDPNLGLDIITGGQRRISISASGSGLHAAWSQKNGQEWDIYYKKSQDGGNTWTQPIRLFKNGLNNNYFYEAEITSQDNGIVYVVALGYSLKDKGGDTYLWTLFGRSSLDGGNTWKGIKVQDNAKVFACDPEIISWGNKILITYSKRSSLRSFYSSDGGTNFSKYSTISDFVKGAPFHSSIAADQDRFYVAWVHDRHSKTDKFYDVFFDRSYHAPSSWEADTLLSSNTSKSKFFMNTSIDINDSGLIKTAITSRTDTNIGGQTVAGKWKTLIKSSSNFGVSFTTLKGFYDKTYEAWNPKISFIDPATKDFIIILEQHYNGNGAEIYGKKKLSSGWQETFPISPLDSKDSAEPDLTIYNGNIYVGWQDYESGNWKLKVQKIN